MLVLVKKQGILDTLEKIDTILTDVDTEVEKRSLKELQQLEEDKNNLECRIREKTKHISNKYDIPI